MLDKNTLNKIFPELQWKGAIPLKYRRNELTPSDDDLDWKRIGNEHFVSKRYAEAMSAYTNALEKEQLPAKDRVDLLANRSAAYLALAKYKLALIDAESALAIDGSHIKCIYRKTMALFGLALYADALEFLNTIVLPQTPGHRKIINNLLTKGRAYIDQSQNGVYPWQEIYKESKENLDLAEFKGPVVVKPTPSKGRGLFATETINAGQLILASKAFAYVADDDPYEMVMNVNIETNRMTTKTQTRLVSSILHILKENPEKCPEVYDLYAGPELGHVVYEKDVQADHLYDMKRIDAICSYNAFGREKHKFRRGASDYSGLWITTSYINHSCVDANSFFHQSGNFIFLRAFHDIRADAEILISYGPPDKLICQQKLDSYGFVCDCRLCARDRMDSVETQTYRAVLHSELEKIAERHFGSANIPQTML